MKRRITIVGNPNSGPPPLAFSPDAKKLICLHITDSFPQVWDVRSGKFLKTSLRHDVLAISPDGKRVVTTDWGGVDSIKIENLDIRLF
jgi:WD40 repeat protein